jgi:hypothetical protein
MHLSYFEVAIDVAIEAQIAVSPASERRMQTDVVPLGVFEAGISAKSTRHWRGFDQDRTACSGDTRDGAVQLAVAVQIDHRSVAAWLLQWPLYQSPGYATPLCGEDAHHVAGISEVILLQSAPKNRLVEPLGAVQIGAGNLEPRCC